MKIRFWHVFAFTFVACTVALVLLLRSGTDALGGKWSIDQQMRDGESTVILKWAGVIDPPMARRLRTAFKNHKGTADRFRIELSSPGGSVDEGESVIRVIERMKKTHRVETYVGADDECLSMCVPIYLQGDFRVAAADSEWMFHEVLFTDPLTGEESFTYEFETRQASLKMFFRYFENSEMDPAWRKKMARDIRGQEVWKTGRELKRERSNVVMVIE